MKERHTRQRAAMDLLVVEPTAETVLTQKHFKAKGACN